MIEQVIGFNGMSTHLVLSDAQSLGNHLYITFIFKFLCSRFLRFFFSDRINFYQIYLTHRLVQNRCYSLVQSRPWSNGNGVRV